MIQRLLISLLALGIVHSPRGLCLQELSFGFDLYIFVRMWPATFCQDMEALSGVVDEYREQQCSMSPYQRFTIHGLWPEYDSGTWPQYCHEEDTSNSTFTPSLQMKCEWPSFHGTSADFWEHEWKKHGTCAQHLLGNKTEYYNTVLQLNTETDLNQLLLNKLNSRFFNHFTSLNNDNSPNNNLILASDIEHLVRNAFNVTPLLACNELASLSELWMCYDVDLRLIECPHKVRPQHVCPEHINLPGGSDVPLQCAGYFPKSTSKQKSVFSMIYCILFMIGMLCMYLYTSRGEKTEEVYSILPS